jgi:beta-mannosidase
MPIPKDFASFCWVSQIDQALAIRTAVEHWRRLKPWCMGALYWQLNDLWPVASWASIDWHGRWKALHHAAGRFFAPLLVSVTQEKGVLTVWATSDLPRPLRLAGALELFAWSGKRVARLPLKARLAANESRAIASVPVTKLLKGRAEPHEVCGFVRLSGDGAKAENFVNLVPWKWATLPRPAITAKLSQSRKGISLTVASQQVAPFFHAELTGLEGHFAGDWQVLRPGQTYVMPWVPHRDRGAEMPTLSTARKLLDTFSLYDTFAH